MQWCMKLTLFIFVCHPRRKQWAKNELLNWPVAQFGANWAFFSWGKHQVDSFVILIHKFVGNNGQIDCWVNSLQFSNKKNTTKKHYLNSSLAQFTTNWKSMKLYSRLIPKRKQNKGLNKEFLKFVLFHLFVKGQCYLHLI